MLSVLFATEVYYTINENNNEETQIAGGNWEKLIRPSAFKKKIFLPLRKAYFVLAFSCWGKKNLNLKCWISIFENQHNFNLIISDSLLYNINIRIGTYLDQPHAIK